MKITVETTTTQSKEIELPEFPFYLKRIYSVYKIINKNNCIAANDHCSPSIECYSHTAVAFKDFENSKIITEKEFKEFYEMVLNKIEARL